MANATAAEFPEHPFAWKILGAILNQTGRLNESLVFMRRAVELSPLDAEVHYNLGSTLQKLGQLDEAKTSYDRAIKLAPDFSDAYYNLANTLRDLTKFKDAEASYKQAIKLAPGFANAHYNLGKILHELSRLEEAEDSFARAVELNPQFAGAHCNLGNVQQELGKLTDAAKSQARAIALKPDYVEAHYNLGNSLKAQGRPGDAEAPYRQAIVLKPDFASAHNNLGVVLKAQGKLAEAEASYIRAIALQPDFADAHSNLGVALEESGRLKLALKSCARAIAVKPEGAEAHYNLANVLRALGRLGDAEKHYQQAIALKSDFAEARNNLGTSLRLMGRHKEALACYRETNLLDPDFAPAISNLLFLNASTEFDTSSYLEDAQRFSDLVAKRVISAFSSWTCSKSSKSLRVGFVSGDFKDHPVGYFLEGILSSLQTTNIELYAYPTSHVFGETTERLKALFDSWTPLQGKIDRDAAAMIHNDGIHILIDLSGHTNRNRLPVFGWRPAPIQISWLGYFASTGLPEIDYIVGDPFVTPKEEADRYSEEIWQLPETYLCFTPPRQKLAVSPLPALSNGFITFGCFNKISKMTKEVVSVRAEILRSIPDSKLFLKDKQFDYKSARESILSRFAAFGITADQLLLEGQSTRQEYLACYDRVDIALSPFPYGGGATSVEGMWMGVPVLSLKGHHFLSHLGESIAHNSKLANWIAVNTGDYISKAIEFSSDLKSLAKLRAGLREHLLSTPLFDVKRFSDHFERALWEMKESINYGE